MDISCPANRGLIYGSYFSVSCRQASRPSLSPARNTVLRAAPLQIMSIIQWSCADAARSSSSRIVTFGIGAPAFATSTINFCRRGTAAPAYPLNTVLQSRHASWAPENSPGFPNSRVSTPTPVACDPRSGARISCLSAASSFAACCLLWASSACKSAFCLVKLSSAVVNC